MNSALINQALCISLPRIPLQEYSSSFISEQNFIVTKIIDFFILDQDQFRLFCNGYHDHILDKLNRKLIMNASFPSLLKIASICHDQLIQNEFAVFRQKSSREINDLQSFKVAIAEFLHSASLIRLKEQIEDGINKSEILSPRFVLQQEMINN